MRFVKEGETVTGNLNRKVLSILDGASDWILLEDLEKQMKFPPFICRTLLRPDIVIFSKDSNTVIIIELTCPCEENFEYWNGFKLIKYGDLKKECELAGWKVILFAVEVGARGFASSSLKSCFQQLGIVGKKLRVSLDQVATAAIRASFWIWMKRTEMPTEKPCDEHTTTMFASIKKTGKESWPSLLIRQIALCNRERK